MLTGVTWPLLTNVIRGRKMSNTFGMVRHYANGSPKPHQGWDFEAAVNTPTYAVADGEVVFAVKHSQGAYGKQLCLRFRYEGKTYYAFYAHLNAVLVDAGDPVRAGEMIATTGKTGNASNQAAAEDHLHFEIRTQAYCGLGLPGRVSPLKIYGFCPLHVPVSGWISTGMKKAVTA